MTLQELGIDVEDYLSYIRGDDMDADKERLIEDHFTELELVENMTTEQKARQLALTLVGEDQNPQPLVDVLLEMAQWQRDQLLKEAIEGKVEWWDGDKFLDYDQSAMDNLFKLKGLNGGDKVNIIIVKED